MSTLQRVMLAVIFLARTVAAQPWRVDSTKISQAAQDATGQVWGITYDVGWGFFRWEHDSWKSAAVPGIPTASWPFAISRGPDGAVYCLWGAEENPHAVTWHKGTSSRVLAQFTGAIGILPRIFVDRGGTAWISSQGRHIYRVSPEGEAQDVDTIADGQLRNEAPPFNGRAWLNPVFATGDNRGRVWFWSDCLAGGTNLASLRGVLIADGRKFEHHSHLDGVPDRGFSIIAPDDANHMWLAVADDQLYRVDIDTLAGTPVPEPSPHAFRYVQKIFQANQDTYLVAGSVWQAVPERSGGGRSGVLWRRRAGNWERVVDGLDMGPDFVQHPFRPFFTDSQGLWVGAFDLGPWFLPSGGGKPALVDWHYDYPLNGSEALFQLTDGHMLLISANQGSIAVNPSDLLAAFQASPGVSTLNPMQALTQDVRGHILGVLASADNALSDWDGKSWTSHPLPGGFDSARFGTLAQDSRHRVWLLSDPFGKSVAIFDPVAATFETYPDYPAALEAQLPRLEGFHLEPALFMVPSYTQDGRICYRDERLHVRYFDGRKWRNWERKEIDGSNQPFVDGPAFFDRAGNLAVNIEGGTWEFTEAKGWHHAEFERGLGTDREIHAHLRLAPPVGCDIGTPESIVRDQVGIYWLTVQGQLFRAIPGACLPEFAPRGRQPFIDGRRVRRVFVDLEGNAFLETYFSSGTGEYVIVSARPPLPHASITARVDAGGTVKLHLDVPTKGKTWITWRTDGEMWASPTQGTEATIRGLAKGKHRIEAVAIDERLQADPRPAVAEIDIRVDSRQQLAALIEKLKDPDYSAREAAVTGLARQPALAIPLLQSARETATPDQRWWIDAAIQRIQNQNRSENQR